MDLQEAFGQFEAHLAANVGNLRELSYQFGPRLTFDPHAEMFPQHIDANSMLKGEYRQPFVVPEHV